MPDILANQPPDSHQGQQQDHESKSIMTDGAVASTKVGKDDTMSSRPALGRGRKNTTIDSVASYPGSVRINAEGAFIVDEDPSSPSGNGSFSDGTKEIRLPHQSPVSHIAVDVSMTNFSSVFWSPILKKKQEKERERKGYRGSNFIIFGKNADQFESCLLTFAGLDWRITCQSCLLYSRP